MYTGLAIALVGGGLAAGSWWPVLLVPVALTLVALLVIGPEERYLTQRFGAAYTDYQGRVRRWL
jgi:protein-S-isoprenylcysteine O-methyltransferase Ste14